MHPSSKKGKRISRACDFCHSRGLKCKAIPSEGMPPAGSGCMTCAEHSVTCTYQRVCRKRGTKPGSKKERQRESQSHSDRLRPWEEMNSRDAPPSKTRTVLQVWVDIYLDSIHPVFPLYCEQELLTGWGKRVLPSTKPSYASFIAMCALSAVHAQRGALFTAEFPQVKEVGPFAAEYLKQALDLTPTHLEECKDLDYLRCFSILALIGTQIRDANLTHRFLGLYHAAVARDALHNESRWPSYFTSCDKEVLRRIFWATYKLEVHHACVMGHLIRVPEAQCFVKYPAGFHHQEGIPGRNGKFEDWYPGWNFTTDLYRILEHAIVELRAVRASRSMGLPQISFSRSPSIIEQLSTMQSSLMPRFLEAAPRSPTDNGRNRCSFQTAKIISTIQLVRMATLASLSNLDEACHGAEELIQSMRSIPNEYIRAFGTPLLHEICGVGHLLGSLAEKHISDESRQRLRQALSSIIVLVKDIDLRTDGLTENADRLREQIERIDQIQHATTAEANGTDEPSGSSPLQALPCTGEEILGSNDCYQEFEWPWDGEALSADMGLFDLEDELDDFTPQRKFQGNSHSFLRGV